jgi:hypothetical protein
MAGPTLTGYNALSCGYSSDFRRHGGIDALRVSAGRPARGAAPARRWKVLPRAGGAALRDVARPPIPDLLRRMGWLERAVRSGHASDSRGGTGDRVAGAYRRVFRGLLLFNAFDPAMPRSELAGARIRAGCITGLPHSSAIAEDKPALASWVAFMRDLIRGSMLRRSRRRRNGPSKSARRWNSAPTKA